MFKELKILNFRGISRLELKDMSRLNLIVGKNNSGKTTMLEALFLLVGITNPNLIISVNSFRNFSFLIGEVYWKSFFKDLDLNSEINLNAEFDDMSKRALKIKPHKLNEQFVDVNTDKDKKTNKDESNINISSTSMSGTNGLKLEAKISTEISTEKKPFSTEVYFDMERAVKKEPPLVLKSLVGNYKELRSGVFVSETTKYNLADRFNNIQRRKEKDQVINILKKIEPELKDIVLGQEGIIYVDVGLNELVPLWLMGDGIVKISAVIFAILDTKGGYVFLDEIENCLYLDSQKILWETIAELSEKYKVQVFATTHSYENVEAFFNVLKDDLTGSLFRIEDKNKLVYFEREKIKYFIENNWEIR